MIMAGVGFLVWAGISHREGIDDADSSKTARGWFLCFLGIGLLLVVAGIRLQVGTRNNWLRRVARRQVNGRSDKIVNPDAPGVRFVEVVPKSAWNDASLLDNAAAVGFVDFKNGCLLFEGDNERYRIPARAIIKCEQDYYSRRSPASDDSNSWNIQYHFVIVTMKTSDQTSVEVPFRIRETVSWWSNQKAREANYEFLRQINHLKASVPAGSER